MTTYGTSDYLRDTAVVDVTTTNPGANGQHTGKAAVVVLGVEGGGAAPAGTSTDPSYVAPIGCVATASFTPAAGAYSAGDIVSVAQAFNWTNSATGLPVRPGSIIRVFDASIRVNVTALEGAEGAYVLQNYRVTPPSARADNAAWAASAADVDAYIEPLSLGTIADLGGFLHVRQRNVDFDIQLATGSSTSYAELVTTPGLTATAVARQVRLIGAVI